MDEFSPQHEPPVGKFSLEDQKFLRELGISAMPKGLEFALNQQRQAQEARKRLERRADGLQSIQLDEAGLTKLAEQRGIPLETLRAELGLFRDIEKFRDPE